MKKKGTRLLLKIGVLLGDDIGLEVVPECVKVMREAAAKVGLDVEWTSLPIGKLGHEEHGDTLPQVTLDTLPGLHGWVLGPIGHAAYPRNDPTWVFPPLRKKFELFASIKPVRSYPNLPCVHQDVDIVFVREVTEGLQSSDTVTAGSGEFRPNDEITVASRIITRTGSRRLARECFEIARRRPRRKLTCVHKEPIYRLACGMFAEEFRKMAPEYPDVTFEEGMIDTVAMKLVMRPQQYDVVVTTNQFGDILTDEGAGLVGGLGLAPGICAGTNQAMAQATHGSAPDIAGQGIANPYAMIMSGGLLLDWLGRRHNEARATEAARLIASAMERVVADGRQLTRDLGGEAGTAEMGDAVARAVAG